MNKAPQAQSGGARPMPGMGPGPGGRHNARLHVEKPKNAKATIFRLLRYIGRNGKLFFLLLFFMLITTLVDLLGPMLQ
jgi:ATP-binding cassette subfamily B protein